MSRDNQTKLSNKKYAQRSKKEDEKLRNKKNNEESDCSSDNSVEEDDSAYDSANEMDVHEYRKFLSKIFPSNHLKNKIKNGEKVKSIISKNKKYIEEDDDDDDVDEEIWETESEEEKNLSKKKKNSKKKKQIESESESESESEYENSEEELSDNEIKNKKSSKENIIFTIEYATEEDLPDDADYEDEESFISEQETEDEDASVSSSSDEDGDKIPIKLKKNKQCHIKKNDKQKEIVNPEPCSSEHNEIMEQLKQLLEKNPNDKSIKKCIEVYEIDVKKQKEKKERKDKKYKAKNMRIFKKIIRDKNTTDDFSFYEKLDINEQKNIIKELREINKITRIEKPYRMTLLKSNIPVQFKGAAMKKVNSLRHMEPGSGEFYKIKNWVDTFMRIPFDKFEGLPISISDGVEKCHDFMENAQQTLNNAVYGLNDAKMQIMQMLGQLLTNPKAIGTAIAIHGPPGTGKTSLVKEGISKILNRPFAFIALGGATDSSFLEGHGYTYEGSTWGKIVQILIDSKCMNPVIYFDELDKISDTPRGEEIAGILTHLTDTSQNSQFHDKYFAEINFDLSKQK